MFQLQTDLDKLVEWAKTWRMQFNIDKCSVIHLGFSNPKHDYTMLDTCTNKRHKLSSVISERDLGVLVDQKLTFSQHTESQVNKAFRIVGIIRRTFTHFDIKTFKKLYVTLVRPILEYCNVICYPRYKKDLILLESVLQKASKIVSCLRDLSYENRLRTLCLPSTKYRFLRGDLIETYKWFNVYKCSNKLFEAKNKIITRGHLFKLKKKIFVNWT